MPVLVPVISTIAIHPPRPGGQAGRLLVGWAAVMGTGASVLEEVHGSEDYFADELVHIRGDDSRTYQGASSCIVSQLAFSYPNKDS
jgi:hypothetical protein